MEANIKKILREDKIIVSATEPTTDRKKVWLQHSSNSYEGDDIEMLASAYSPTSILVKLKQGSNYCISFNSLNSYKSSTPHIQFKQSDVNGASGTEIKRQGIVEGSNKVIFNAVTEYILILFFRVSASSDVTTISEIMLNEGSTALPYEPYVEPKIYVLNDNNIYEEFVPKEQNNYSTEEQVIGTYLGKPLYRKVITGNFSNGNTLLSNVDKFVSFSGNCKFTGDTWERSLPYGDKALSFVNIQKQAESTNVIIAIMVGGSSSSIIDSEIVLEYTKTTD